MRLLSSFVHILPPSVQNNPISMKHRDMLIRGNEKMGYTKPALWCLFLIVLVTVLTIAQVSGNSKQRKEETLGREYAASVERQVKLVTDPAVLDRVKRIGAELADVANKVEVPATYGNSEIYPFRYQFKVIEDEDVNAFSLPGGIIYVNTGLLNLADSDDELAGVLAHEIAHAAHHHMTYLMRKSSSVDRYVALIALTGILSNIHSRDLNNLLLGAQMMKIGKLSSYTQEAEIDADRTAVAYLAKSRYSPEGMLAFMKKLEVKRMENPTLPLGIYQTHPAPYKRAYAIAKAMREEGLSPDLRRIQDIAYAKPEPIKDKEDLYQVVLSNRVFCQPASLGSGPCSKERAEQIAKRVNSILDEGLKPTDISCDLSRQSLLAKGVEILKIEKEDVDLQSKDGANLLKQAQSVLEYAIWADWLCNDWVADVASAGY